VQLIAVSLNSAGGSIVQARNISSILKKYSHKTGAPIYTFAEDAVLSSANIIHSSGNKVFANEFTIMGEFGYTVKQFGLQKFIKNWNVDQEFITAGANKVRLDRFKDLKPEDVKWINNILLEWEYELKSDIINNRSHKFKELKVKNESLESEIFQQTLITPENANKIGLIDQVSSLDSLLEARFAGMKVIDVMKSGLFDDGSAPSSRAETASQELIELLNQRLTHN